jgi:hypothetical protein
VDRAPHAGALKVSIRGAVAFLVTGYGVVLSIASLNAEPVPGCGRGASRENQGCHARRMSHSHSRWETVCVRIAIQPVGTHRAIGCICRSCTSVQEAPIG